MERKEYIKQLFRNYIAGQSSEDEDEELKEYFVQEGIEESEWADILEPAWTNEPSERNEFQDAVEGFDRIRAIIEPPRRKNSIILFLKIAACLLLPLLSIFTYYYLSHPSIKSEIEISFIEETTKQGESLKILLPDSSVVYLSSLSKLKWPNTFIDSKSREVYLEGEAFFDVYKNPNQPFLIHSKNFITSVLGTSFNITSYFEDEEHSVLVKTGKVSVSKKTENGNLELLSNLIPGELLTYNHIKDEFAVRKVEMDQTNDWLSRHLVFHEASLEEVLKQLSRYYKVDFEYEADLLNSAFRFNATFNHNSLESILKQLNMMSSGSIKTRDMNNGKIKIWREGI